MTLKEEEEKKALWIEFTVEIGSLFGVEISKDIEKAHFFANPESLTANELEDELCRLMDGWIERQAEWDEIIYSP
ncbi:MAG: hypothetical protein LBI65_00580 [Candidatus Symbiothrix sp.]|jgi:hypothetical protein|nr:hypothetical protein [Candidatus Symbiothrix sp.]